MTTDAPLEEAVEILQELGLKEYEAKCFVGLSRLETGTAKQLGEITEVPRTRVYDAIRVLEAKGLVEIHHSSPQQFRAVSLEEATETLRDQYEDRVERLSELLEHAERAELSDEEPIQKVWSMSGTNAIANRADQIIRDSTDEVVLVIGDESLLTEELINALNSLDDDTELLVGAVTRPLEDRIREVVPKATAFLSGLDWLHGEQDTDSLTIGRLLLVDRETILVSTIMPETGEEQAIFGGGFRNGLIVISRRLLAQGLLPRRDPERS